VRRDGHQGYIKYALERGVATPLLWTAALLEARLYAERKDLLFAYFDISVAQRARSRESSTRRNLAMKRRVAKELIKSKYELKIGPWGKFEQSEAIIHSVDDTSYPEVDPSSVGISGWFKVEFCDLYFNGIEFLMRVELAVSDSEGRWAIMPYGETVTTYEELREFRVYRVGRLPYRNIVEIDAVGDEYYRCPHIYCIFADGGMPWERFVYRYVTDGGEYPQHLDSSSQCPYEDLITGAIRK
jgi:hypothetical protein